MEKFVVLIALFVLCHAAQGQTWSWGGELRLRTQVEKDGDVDSRLRERIRVRLGMNANVNEFVNVHIRMATSTDQRNDDQTLGDNTAAGSRRRSFGLDLAQVEWAPYEFFKVYGGRFSQIHYSPGGSQVLLDEEISLEGAGASAVYAIAPQWKVLLNGGSVYMRENYDSFLSLDETDNMINWAQLRGEWQNEYFFATAGFGFFNFVAVEGKNFADLSPGGVAGGNSENVVGVVKNPYLPKQYFAEFKWTPNQYQVGVFAELVSNTETKDPHQALWTGLTFANAAWDLRLAYLKKESDSVLSSFTDSDFAGGRTDAHGTVNSIGWKFAKNLSTRLTHSDSRVSVAGIERTYWYSHLDLTAQF